MSLEIKPATAQLGRRCWNQRYLTDRERLLAAISHDLKTPITRLKLRTEMLDDDTIRAELDEDLDTMVKGALQSVKDSDIRESRARSRCRRAMYRRPRTSFERLRRAIAGLALPGRSNTGGQAKRVGGCRRPACPSRGFGSTMSGDV